MGNFDFQHIHGITEEVEEGERSLSNFLRRGDEQNEVVHSGTLF